jgi:hypothetical protein
VERVVDANIKAQCQRGRWPNISQTESIVSDTLRLLAANLPTVEVIVIGALASIAASLVANPCVPSDSVRRLIIDHVGYDFIAKVRVFL